MWHRLVEDPSRYLVVESALADSCPFHQQEDQGHRIMAAARLVLVAHNSDSEKAVVVHSDYLVEGTAQSLPSCSPLDLTFEIGECWTEIYQGAWGYAVVLGAVEVVMPLPAGLQDWQYVHWLDQAT